MARHAFTEAQAAHALEVVLKLMKEQHFFLYRHDPRSTDKNPDYTLDPEMFGPALELDRKIRSALAYALAEAEEKILAAEQELGVTVPNLSGDKQFVQCKRYTGGLDICRVYPLTAFAQYVPDSLGRLALRCFGQFVQARGDPVLHEEYDDKVDKVSKKIWEQFRAMDVWNPANQRCVVMMKTQFDCKDSDENRDFMQGRTRDMQEFPHALGYLFYQYSLYNRIVPNNHVVFSTSRDSHVNMEHWWDKSPTLWYEKDGGYGCPVIFVTVL